MPITPRYMLVCDQIRQEANGKFLIVGLYTPDIVVDAVPAVLPMLAFLVALDSTEAGTITATFQFSHADQILVCGSIEAILARPGVVILPFNVGPVQVMSAGLYTFSVQIVGQATPLTHTFAVHLNATMPAAAVPRGDRVFALRAARPPGSDFIAH